MTRLLFLDPGHFHAALTLRVSHPRVADEVFVYAADGPELRDFLALIERFNRRPEGPTRWRPVVTTCADPLSRLVEERRGDVVVLAGRNGGKARTIRTLHDAGFPVLADKPWLVQPEDLDHIAASLSGGPLVMEIITGRHDVAAQVFRRLVGTPGVFGAFRDDGPGIALESVHGLEKLVDGAPLRRPWWFFDVRVQGSGAVDIPTHMVNQAQWLVDGAPELVSAKVSSTRVPLDAFRRITREPGFPPELQPFVQGDSLSYRCNAELLFRIGRVETRAVTRWDLSSPPGGGDSSVVVAHGSRADVRREQGVRRRVVVEPRKDGREVGRALTDGVLGWQDELPGVDVESADGGRYEITIPATLDGGHETHFAQVLDEFLELVDDHSWPARLVQETLAKYTLLAEAAARTNTIT